MAYNPQNPNGQATMANSAPVVIASDQSSLPIKLSQDDAFGQVVTSTRYSQVEVSFDQTDPDAITDITVTKTSTGDASNLNGQAVFTTGTGTTGGVIASTNTSVSYRPHAEVYGAFSAIFTAGTSDSYQRIGIYDVNNGFFIGYEGTSFGITIRKGGSDTTTAQASFNVDTLLGSAGSKYTRAGVPEAIDTTKDNLYRIRFGWLGAAPIRYEVLSPDGDWVLFHIIRHPNAATSTGPTIYNPDLPITLDVRKTSGATAIVMNTACWAIGTSSDQQKIGATITDNTLVKPVRSVLVAKQPSGAYTNIDATAGGNLKVALEEIDGAAGTLTTTLVSNATGGDSTFHLVSAATANATNIKASAGVVTGWYIYNSNGSARKVAFHNTNGTPTAGASIFYTLVIPALSAANVSLPTGIAFSSGIAITTVTGLADNDASFVGANDLNINIFYK